LITFNEIKLILINEIEQRAKIIFLSAGYVWS